MPIAYLQVALVAASAMLLLLGLVIAVRRTWFDWHLRRLTRQEAALRPHILAIIAEDDDIDIQALARLTGASGKVLEALIWKMLPKVSGSARVALIGILHDRKAIQRARARTRHFSSTTRALAAEQLGAAGDSPSLDDLVRLLTNRHAEVRIVAARALGKLGDPRAVGPLLRCLDRTRQVPAGHITMALLHLGPSAIDALVTNLEHPSAKVRTVTAELVGLHGVIKAISTLQHLLDDEILDVRVSAAKALGRIGMPVAIEPLCRLIGPANPHQLRIEAIRALGIIGGAQTLRPLRSALVDSDPTIATMAGGALVTQGNMGISILEEIQQTGGRASQHANYTLALHAIAEASRRTGVSRRRNMVDVT